MQLRKARQVETAGTKKLRLLPIAALFVLLIAAAISMGSYFHNGHDLNAFMEEHYGRWNSEKKWWEKSADEPGYVVCASQDVDIKGEPHHMLAVCGELPDELAQHPEKA